MASLLPIKGGSGMKPSGSLSELPLDEKKAEKHLKKARPFFDDKLKAKQRLSSLWTYIEATGDTEQQRFFAENQTAIATTVCDAFYYQIDKIRAKEKDRGLLVTGKEAAELLRILGVVQYIFRHLGPALPQASYADGLVGLLEVLLADTNHPRLRLEGFRLLLLLYARIGTAWTPIDGFYQRGVSLKALSSFILPDESNAEPSGAPGTPLATGPPYEASQADSRPRLTGNTHPPQPDDLVEIIEEILFNIVFWHEQAAAAAAASSLPWHETDEGVTLVFMWSLFCENCLSIVFPNSVYASQTYNVPIRAASMGPSYNDGLKLQYTFTTCPPQILYSLMNFLVRSVVCGVSPANDVVHPLRDLLLNNPTSCAWIHEVLGQSTLLPWLYGDVTRGAIQILRMWISPHELPTFLAESVSQNLSQTGSRLNETPILIRPTFMDLLCEEALSTLSYTDYLLKYFRFVGNIFVRRSCRESEQEMQKTVYREAIMLLRYWLSMTEMIPPATHGALLTTLREIQENVLGRNFPNDNLETIPEMVVETLVVAMIRLAHDNEAFWVGFRTTMIKSLHCDETVQVWSAHMQQLTHLLTVVRYRLNPRDDAEEHSSKGREERRGRGMLSQSSPRQRPQPTTQPSAAVLEPLVIDVSARGPKEPAVVDDSTKSTGHAPTDATSVRGTVSLAANDVKGSTESKSPQGGSRLAVVPETHSTELLKSHSHAKLEPIRLFKDLKLTVASMSTSPTEPAALNPTVSHPMPVLMAGGLNANTTMSTVHLNQYQPPPPIAAPFSPSTPSAVMPTLSTLSTRKISLFAASLVPGGPCAEFTQYTRLAWTGDGALHVWKNMLCSLGNINDIQIPTVHEHAIKTVVDVWDQLERIRLLQPFMEPDMPALFDFSLWIFEAADLMHVLYAPLAPATRTYHASRAAPATPIKGELLDKHPFMKGIAIAFGAMCRHMARRHDQFFPLELLAHFYRLLKAGLESKSMVIIHAIVVNSVKLMHLDLPGVHVVIPAWLDGFMYMIQSPWVLLPETTRCAAAQILLSFCDLPDHLFPDDIENTDDVRPEIWRRRAFEILLTLCNEEFVSSREDHTVHLMLMRGVGVVTFVEAFRHAKVRDKSLLDRCFTCLLDHLTSDALAVVQIAGDIFRSLAMMLPKTSIDPLVMRAVIHQLASAIDETRAVAEAKRTAAAAMQVATLLNTLKDWIMACPIDLFSDRSTSSLIFEVAEIAMNFSLDKPAVAAVPERPASAHKNRRLISFGPDSSSAAQNRRSTTQTPPGESERLDKDGAHGGGAPGHPEPHIEEIENTVVQAAETFLQHILHHWNHFTPSSMPPVISSQIKERVLTDPNAATNQRRQADDTTDEWPAFFFTVNETVLVTIVDVSASGAKDHEIRMITRDQSGKYTWDASLFYESFTDRGASDNEPSSKEAGETGSGSPASAVPSLLPLPWAKHTSFCAKAEAVRHVTSNYQRKPRVLPRYKKNAEIGKTDMLHELLAYIGTAHAHCLTEGRATLNEPARTLAATESLVAEIGQAMVEQAQHEGHIARHTDAYETPIATPAEAVGDHIPFQKGRLFLSHLGHLNFDGLKDDYFHLLTPSPSLFRDLRGLDLKAGREVLKIAVIYVKHGQETEQAILQNSQGSCEYQEFVASMGWEIDLSVHIGFMGGLEKNQTTGAKANYFCTAATEIVFHDATKLPTDLSDPRQVKKKRHIGNDHVHIVWNEHWRPYRPKTIGGDFGNAIIVVTPLRHDRYSIDIHRDASLPPFGPLETGVIVGKHLLGPLVRATAIHACRSAMHMPAHRPVTASSNMPAPVPAAAVLPHGAHDALAQRASDIRIITQRHKAARWTYRKLVENVFMSAA